MNLLQPILNQLQLGLQNSETGTLTLETYRGGGNLS